MKAIPFWVLVGTAALTAAVPPAAAHSGRTDSSGCHTCRTNCSKYGLRTGQYHCHGGGRSSASSRIQPPPPSPPPPPSVPIQLFREGELPAGDQLPENSIVVHPRQPARSEPGLLIEVLTVVDGDTFVARDGERLYLLKLRDIEAPELDQIYGIEARKRLAERVAGRRIVVWPEKGEGCVVPVQAETLEGTDVSGQLLSEGLAWASRSAPDDRRRVEAGARLGRVGLWGGSKPEPPWEYRSRRTMARKAKRP